MSLQQACDIGDLTGPDRGSLEDQRRELCDSGWMAISGCAASSEHPKRVLCVPTACCLLLSLVGMGSGCDSVWRDGCAAHGPGARAASIQLSPLGQRSSTFPRFIGAPRWPPWAGLAGQLRSPLPSTGSTNVTYCGCSNQVRRLAADV